MPDSQNTTQSDFTQLQDGQGFPADNHRTGEPGLVGKDDFTREYEIGRLQRGRQQALSGNFADLQRIGAALAVDGKLPQGVAPPGINPKDENVLTPAQHDAAKGEWTVESERAGLIPRRPAPIPAENRDADSIDPTSTSPQVQAKGSQSASKPAPK